MQKTRNIENGIKKLVAFAALICTLTNCDPCLKPNESGEAGNRIFFSAAAQNGNSASVYSVEYTGNYMVKIVSDALIYSEPADNGRIAVVKYDKAANKNSLWIFSGDGKDSSKIGEDNKLYTISTPIISNSGTSVLFGGGSEKLFIWAINSSSGAPYFDYFSNKFFEKITPAFSSDGKYIAFVETNNSGDGYVFKIVDALKRDVAVYSKELSAKDFAFLAEPVIKSSGDGTKFYLAVAKLSDAGKLCGLIKIAVNGGDESFIDLKESSAESAAISPDEKKCAISLTDGKAITVKIDGLTKYTALSGEPGDKIFGLAWNKNSDKLLYSITGISDEAASIYCVLVGEDAKLTSAPALLNSSGIKGFFSRKK